MSTHSIFFPRCSGCGAVLGSMDEHEFAALIVAEGLAALCFDCDHQSAANLPEFFLKCKQGDFFRVHDQWFEYWDIPGVKDEFIPFTPTHAHEDSCAVCLSSSTYLNTPAKNSGDRIGDYAVEPCHDCHGTGQLLEFGYSVDCPTCGGVGQTYKLLTIPKWVISGGVGK